MSRQITKVQNIDESTLEESSTLGFSTLTNLISSTTCGQVRLMMQILSAHNFPLARWGSVGPEKRHNRSNKCRHPVESRQIKISKCSLRKRVNPPQSRLDTGGCQSLLPMIKIGEPLSPMCFYPLFCCRNTISM